MATMPAQLGTTKQEPPHGLETTGTVGVGRKEGAETHHANGEKGLGGGVGSGSGSVTLAYKNNSISNINNVNTLSGISNKEVITTNIDRIKINGNPTGTGSAGRRGSGVSRRASTSSTSSWEYSTDDESEDDLFVGYHNALIGGSGEVQAQVGLGLGGGVQVGKTVLGRAVPVIPPSFWEKTDEVVVQAAAKVARQSSVLSDDGGVSDLTSGGETDGDDYDTTTTPNLSNKSNGNGFSYSVDELDDVEMDKIWENAPHWLGNAEDDDNNAEGIASMLELDLDVESSEMTTLSADQLVHQSPIADVDVENERDRMSFSFSNNNDDEEEEEEVAGRAGQEDDGEDGDADYDDNDDARSTCSSVSSAWSASSSTSSFSSASSAARASTQSLMVPASSTSMSAGGWVTRPAASTIMSNNYSTTTNNNSNNNTIINNNSSTNNAAAAAAMAAANGLGEEKAALFIHLVSLLPKIETVPTMNNNNTDNKRKADRINNSTYESEYLQQERNRYQAGRGSSNGGGGGGVQVTRKPWEVFQSQAQGPTFAMNPPRSFLRRTSSSTSSSSIASASSSVTSPAISFSARSASRNASIAIANTMREEEDSDETDASSTMGEEDEEVDVGQDSDDHESVQGSGNDEDYKEDGEEAAAAGEEEEGSQSDASSSSSPSAYLLEPVRYNAKQRAAAIARYLKKRERRVWTKKAMYRSREAVANGRSRQKGRFASSDVKFVPVSAFKDMKW